MSGKRIEISLQSSPESIFQYLRERYLLTRNEPVLAVENPGQGNMNMVVRARTARRGLILKQAKPYVQKFPHIPAPVERGWIECLFYQAVSRKKEVARRMPAFLDFDPANSVLVIEDLGENTDYTFIYQKGAVFLPEEIAEAVEYLQALHHANIRLPIREGFPDNMALRMLNAEHLFRFPFLEDNGFDLDTVQPGLQALAMPWKTNEKIKAALAPLAKIYLDPGNGPAFLHGDFYPGSWLKTANGFKVIDAEFCFFGRPEYDLGVFRAHLALARVPENWVEAALAAKYVSLKNHDSGLVRRFEGMEIFRRLIGLAQLPVDLSLEEKDGLLRRAAGLLLG